MVHSYDFVRHISSGRFGVTILVKVNERLAVMKTIDAGRLKDGEMQGVLAEVKKLATHLHNPYLLGLHESFLNGNVLCLISDYLEGGNAAGKVELAKATGRNIGEQLIFRWLAQTAVALQHLHGRGVMHRDLRTSRLLLDVREHVVVSCMAITSVLDHQLYAEKPCIEAVGYMSPELVAASCKHSPASDMWALGVVFFELASLGLPYRHEHPRGLAELILSAPVRHLPGRCSLQMRNLCASLLQRDPSDRPSATEFLHKAPLQESIKELLNSEPPRPKHQPYSARQAPRPAPAMVPPSTPNHALRQCSLEPLMLKGPAAPPQTLCCLSTKPGALSGGAGVLVGPRAHLGRRRRAVSSMDEGPLRLAPLKASLRRSTTARPSMGAIEAPLSERQTLTTCGWATNDAVAEVVIDVLRDLSLDVSCLLELSELQDSRGHVDARPAEPQLWDQPPAPHERDLPRFT